MLDSSTDGASLPSRKIDLFLRKLETFETLIMGLSQYGAEILGRRWPDVTTLPRQRWHRDFGFRFIECVFVVGRS